MKGLKNFILVMSMLAISTLSAFSAPSDTRTAELQFQLPSYTYITPVTSPVLVANITDRTGNLFAPLSTKFKIVTNAKDNLKLYLKANIVTDSGYEEAMFEQGGQVYIAFGNLSRIPSSSALRNCKFGSSPKDSPGVVAYPVTGIIGAEHKTFLRGKSKYELDVNPGTQYVSVNVGANVLKSSFAANDPRGFYQAVLSLTEADI